MRTTSQNQNATHQADTGTMRAIVQDVYGTTDTWQVADIPKPEIEPDEVLVRVHAAGLDRGTWHVMTGRPYLMRVMGFGFRGPKNRVPGLAAAGTVVAIGREVTRFSVGDDVYGVSRGAFAEFAAAPEDKLVHKPTNLTFEQAAAVPVAVGRDVVSDSPFHQAGLAPSQRSARSAAMQPKAAAVTACR